MTTRWAKRGLLGGALGMALLTCAAADASAQDADRDGWRTRWSLGLESTFDQNPFRLTNGQRNELMAGGDRYAALSRPYEVTNSVRLGLDLRGRGLGGRRLDIESDVRMNVYTFNSRSPSVDAGLSATQRFSKRDRVRIGLDLTPSEFRRNYLAPDGADGFHYVAGTATSLETELAYAHELLRGRKGRPELTVGATLSAGRRTIRDLPWRDRSEFGGGLEADLDAGALGLELRAAGARAFDGYDAAEPVSTEAGVVMTPLERGFNELRLGAEVSLRAGKRSRLVAEYDLRQRRNLASLDEDRYNGGRRDRRHSLGGSIRYDLRHLELVMGGEHQFQTSFRPGQGDTGDEADYRRSRAFLGVEYRR